MDPRLKLRIHLIEDDSNFALLIQRFLEKWSSGPFELIRSVSLDEAFPRLEQEEGRADVVLLDLGLPTTRGLETLERVMTQARGVPVIVLTGLEDGETTQKSIEKGARDFVPKRNLDGFLLTRTIHRVVEHERDLETIGRQRRNLAETQALTHVGSWEWDLASNHVEWSDELYRIYGLARDENTPPKPPLSTWGSYVEMLPSIAEAGVPLTQVCGAQNREPLTFEDRVIRPDGTVRILFTQVELIADASGQPARLVGTSQDVTEKREAEEARAASERLARNLIDCSMDMIVAVDCDRKIVEFNGAAEQAFGYHRDEVLGRAVDLLYADAKEGSAVHQAVLECGSSVHEVLNRRKNGAVFPSLLAASALRNASGEIAGVMGVSRDISEKKRQALQTEVFSDLGRELSAASSSMTAAQIIAQAADRLWKWDAFFVNRYLATEHLMHPVLMIDTVNGERREFAIPPKGLPPSPFSARVIQEGPQLILRNPGESTAARELVPFGDPSRRSSSLLFAPVRRGRDVIGLLSVQSYDGNAFERRDLDVLQLLADYCGGALQRLHTEQALRESELKFQELANNIQEVFWIKDIRTQRLLYVTPSVERLWGYSPETLYASPVAWLEAVHPEDRDRVLEAARRKQDIGEYDEEYRLLGPDGAIRWVRERGFPVRNEAGEVYRIVGVAEGITERKMAEDVLRQSEQRFSKIFRSSPVAIGINTVDGSRIIEVNDRWCEWVGYRRDEVIGRSILELQVWADPSERGPIIQMLKAHGFVRGVEARYRRRSGEVFEVLLSMEMIELAGENEPVILAMLIDVTARKAAERSLAKEQHLLRTLLDNLPEAVYVKDLDGRFLLANRALESLVGSPLGSRAIGKTDFDFFPDETARRFQADNRTVAETGVPIIDREEPFVMAGNRRGWFLSSKVPLRNPEGTVTGVIGITRDVTEKKKLEEQFLRAQRLESIGTLASGVAHDMNNILAPIMMASQILRLKSQDEETERFLTNIDVNAQRGSEIVKQLLTFARGQEGKRVLIQAKHLIKDIVKLARETFPKSIQIRSTTASNLWPVLADATQIHQVLLNLSVNARDAMPEGGVIEINAENAHVDEIFASMVPQAKPGPHILLQVKDNGVGIPPEIMDKIFDPFFSTKEPGKGTGLGLSTVQSIVKAHAGFIRVESQARQQTVFRLYLPAIPEGTVSRPENSLGALPMGHAEVILVVDDEASLRALTCELLLRYGYQVIPASDGAEAMVLFAQNKDCINLVLTDMSMPYMRGDVLIQALKRIDPQLKIIASSGTNQHKTASDWENMGVADFLQKPFKAEQLLLSINRVLKTG